ncbi:hypothetical protein H5410_005652 [Solanum commersonii]|uniref:Manganese/iron superoxide dismutase C-terminal domain-containing protein n=1 Tax=Solanum commersonii TaxID=4109 RepID=A0A9J6A7Z0_SOLCO|nr:hypothetical protein H5410_005652 [Solanum commersonii]
MYLSLKVVETFGLEYINTGDLLRKESLEMTCHNMASVLHKLRITIGDGINHETWKHQFFWEPMKPNGGGELSGKLLELINIDFGSYDTFVNEFKAAAAIQFGSCWAWFIYAKLIKARTQQDYDTRKEANNYFRWMELNAFAGLCGLFLSKWLVAKTDKK